MTAEGASEADQVRRSLIAVGAGWVVPGLGHVLLGRRRRGLLFAALVLGSFALGMAHDGRLALWNSKQWILTSMQVIANVGVGPADAIARLSVYGELAYSMPETYAGTAEPKRTKIFRSRERSPSSIYGTAYLWTAGLMNLLLLFDVWDIGMGRKP